MRQHIVLTGMVAIPFALYGALSTVGCALGNGEPTPTTSATSKSAPPETCAADLVETTVQGETLCCSGTLRWCQSKGAPVYDHPCDEAGEARVGVSLSYREDTCEGATFHASEDRLTTQYECRSEDGIQPVWRYAEPSTYCAESVARACVASRVTEVTRTPSGNACDH